MIYPLTFWDRPVIRQQVDAIMEADASDYVRLLLASRWRLFFDTPGETQLPKRELRKVVHHVAYFPVAEGLTRTLMLLATPLGGLSPLGAIYAVNGVLTALNVVLFTLLLQRSGAGASLVFVLLYACALSTWVYAAVPDTWVLSGTLVLLTLLAASAWPHRPGLVSAGVALGVGLFMLNAFTLACLTLVLVPRLARASTTLPELILRAVGACLLSFLGWTVALHVLGRSQPAFAPLGFANDTLEFRSGFVGDFGPLSPLRWGFSFVQMFILSVIANQDRLNFSGLTIVRTAVNVPFGTMGVLLYLGVLAVLGWRLAGDVLHAVRRGCTRAFLSQEHVGWALFVGAWYVVGTVSSYADVILYSPAVLPVFVLLMARYVGTATPAMRALSWGAAALVAINSVEQILRFRALLAAL